MVWLFYVAVTLQVALGVVYRVVIIPLYKNEGEKESKC
jgi:hypothetical protein